MSPKSRPRRKASDAALAHGASYATASKGKKTKAREAPVATGQKRATRGSKPSTAQSKKKRAAESEPSPAPRAPKRPKREPPKKGPPKRGPPLNSPPTQRLDIYVFGAGENGELGLGHLTRNGEAPINVTAPRLNRLLDAATVGVVQMAVGGMHCVALTHDNRILTWGVNDNGALGRDTTWKVSTSDIDAGLGEGLDDDETGLNPKESTPTAIPLPFVPEDTVFVQVAATDNASFALTSYGSVYGWGTFMGSDGIIGFSKAVRKQETLALMTHLKNITALAAGSSHMLALDAQHRIYAWGCGEQSQLGRPVMERYRTAALTPSLVRIPPAKRDRRKARIKLERPLEPPRSSPHVKIEASEIHSSPLPPPSSSSSSPSKAGSGKQKISTITCGHFHSFALSTTGQVFAWGLNNFTQTGIVQPREPQPRSLGDDNNHALDLDPAPLVITKPTFVPLLSVFARSGYGAIAALAGGNHHSIARTTDNTLLSWGRCDTMQSGVPLDSLPEINIARDSQGIARILTIPTVVPHIAAAFVAAGIDNSFAIATAGTAYSWGFGASYRTGQDSEENIETPAMLAYAKMPFRRLTWAGCGGQFSVLAGPQHVKHNRGGQRDEDQVEGESESESEGEDGNRGEVKREDGNRGEVFVENEGK